MPNEPKWPMTSRDDVIIIDMPIRNDKEAEPASRVRPPLDPELSGPR